MSDPTYPELGAAAEAAQRVRSAILDGSLAPGARIVERTIAGDLRVSSIAVRDAFARLEREGYVERLPRRGVRVATLSARDVAETSEVRALLESEAAERAAAAIAAGADDDGLAGLVGDMDRAAAACDRTCLVRLDDAFHAEIARLGGQEAIADVLRTLRARATALVRRAVDLIPDADLALMGPWHLALLDALRAGDPDGARAAARAHVELTRERVADALAHVDAGGR